METNISTKNKNAEKLAAISTIFAIMNGFPTTPEVAKALALAVHVNIVMWYKENGRTYSPDTEEIDDDAIKFAFAKVQTDLVAASMFAGGGLMN